MRNKRTVQVTVQLQKHEDGDLRVAGAERKVALNISHTLHDKTLNNGSDVDKTYSSCSLLLQIGKLLGVCPPHSPSPCISSISNEIVEKWCLRCCGKNNNRSRIIYQLSDINDGDKIRLCCGDYVQNSAASLSNKEVSLLSLIPSKYNIVTVSLDAESLENEGGTNENGREANIDERCSVDVNSDGDDDSDVEDVTDLYVSRKHRALPEVIDLEDVSSDDDDDNDASKSCSGEYCYGRNANYLTKHKTAQANNSRNSRSYNHARNSDNDESDDTEKNLDVESISSDSHSSSSVEDVTELMFAKRNDQAQKMIDEAEEICDSDQECLEDQGVVGKKRKSTRRSQSTVKRRKAKKVESPIEVLIDEKDMPMRPGAKSIQDDDGDSTRSSSGESEVDLCIKQRIVKLLNTGFHGESNENEARNAMKLARKLIERHNLDRAVLLQERGDGSLNDFSTRNDKEGAPLQGGIVTAKILNRKKNKPLYQLPRWHDFLVKPVSMNFHVESFKTLAKSSPLRAGECSVTFYGIETNVQLAAYAFKIASEKIALMAATYEPPKKSNLARAKQALETRTARLSYALGIVKGLQRDVEKELQKEEERRKGDLRKAQRAMKEGEAYHEDDTCSYSDDHRESCLGGVDDDYEHGGSGKLAEDKIDRREISHNKTSFNAVEHLGKLERENTAHLALVDHHKKIASDVLKSKKIKVRPGRKRTSIALNRKSYEKGVIDSKEIDLNQQVIQDK